MPRRTATAAALLGLTLAATPAAAQQAGIYDVTGVNLDGTAYSGTAQIRPMGLTSFIIGWRIGGTVLEGVGIASGRTVAVAYGLSQRPGMGIYTLNADGSMEGEWTIIGALGTGTERLVYRRPAAGAAAPEAAAPPAAPPAPAEPAPAPAPR